MRPTLFKGPFYGPAFDEVLQVGAVNSGSKCARTAIMGLGSDIRNLLVAQIVLLSAFILLTIKVLDLLSFHNCSKSRLRDKRKEETR